MPMEAFLINPAKLKKNRRRKKRKTTRKRRNPLGEEAMILGANPRRRRRRKTRRRRNYAVANRPRRRVRRRRTYAAPARRRRRRNYAANPRRRRRRTYARRYNSPAVYAANPRRRRRRSRRRYRRNPAAFLKVRALDLRDPMTIVTPLLTGVFAKMATEKLPDMMNLTGNQRTLAQLGIAVGGGYMLQGFIGPIGATVWLAVAGAEIASTYVNKILLQLQQATVSGIGYPALGAYPQDFMGLSAYPGEVTNYPV